MINIENQKFGGLFILGRGSKPSYIKNRDIYWNTLCHCGKFSSINGAALRSGNTKSCGCLNKLNIKKIATRHGQCGSRTYVSWQCMLSRCRYATRHNSKYYKEKGITICDRWLNSFKNFLEDMGERPKNKTLDRIDSSKGYFKENCRWATSSEQAINSWKTRKIKAE